MDALTLHVNTNLVKKNTVRIITIRIITDVIRRSTIAQARAGARLDQNASQVAPAFGLVDVTNVQVSVLTNLPN